MRKGRFAGLGIAAPDARRRRFPGIVLILGAPAAIALAAAFGAGSAWIGLAAILAISAAAIGLKLVSDGAQPRDGQGPQDGERAARLVADFEQSGCGWFWETDADGRLAYVSAPLA